MADSLVSMVDIKKQFGNVIALAGVSFDVRPGECHCLLGDNGAGKSTFIKTMSGVHLPSEGYITVGGEKRSFNSPRDARGHRYGVPGPGDDPVDVGDTQFLVGARADSRARYFLPARHQTRQRSDRDGDAQNGYQPARGRSGGGHLVGR